jgi:cytochrome bd-type quinol oxidase subunit 2
VVFSDGLEESGSLFSSAAAAGEPEFCWTFAFTGLYLPLMLVPRLLILRGIAIEFRDHLMLRASFSCRSGVRPENLDGYTLAVGFSCTSLTSAVFGIYPYVLPSSGDPVGLYWFIPGLLLASTYFSFLARHFGHQDGVHSIRDL